MDNDHTFSNNTIGGGKTPQYWLRSKSTEKKFMAHFFRKKSPQSRLAAATKQNFRLDSSKDLHFFQSLLLGKTN